MLIVVVKTTSSLSSQRIIPLLNSLMMSLKFDADEVSTVSAPWRLELSKIDVWYAAFGSNMCKSRFLCYIQGGQVKIIDLYAFVTFISVKALLETFLSLGILFLI